MKARRAFALTEPSNGRRAFTLIELLVVIAIIAILAGILFPVFARARQNAARSRSLSNIRQLTMAIHVYASDNNDTLPGWMALDESGKTFVHNVWDEQVFPNVRSNEVYGNGETGIQSPSQPKPHTRVLTYGLNGLLVTEPRAVLDGHCEWKKPSPMTLSGATNPAGVILLAELATQNTPSRRMARYGQLQTMDYNGGLNASGSGSTSSQYTQALRGWIDIDPRDFVENSAGGAGDYDPATWDETFGVARGLYAGGGVFAFMDGHTRFMRIAQTVTGGEPGVRPETNWSATSPAFANNMWFPN